MTKKILVAYATAAGATTGVAETIGETLRAAGAEVDVHPIKDVSAIDGYDAVVLGTGIRAGQLYGALKRFLKHHHEALSQVPVAYFVVCLTMQEPTAEHCTEVDAYLDPLREQYPEIQPVDVGLFAGALHYKKLALPFRLILKAMKAKEGDFRDWEAIKKWANALHTKLTATA